MSWLQLIVRANPKNSQNIEDALLACGALSITFSDNADQPILEPALGETPLWHQTAVTALFPADVDCKEIDVKLSSAIVQFGESHRWELVEDKDWEREWMAHYHPIDCGHGLWICPSWQAPPEPDATNILLDPGLAFGTGTHPTTLLCLQWLATPEVRAHIAGQTLVDFGCGSGILAIAALKLGAKKVIGVDIDPQALLATQDNAERNGIQADQIQTYLPEQAPISQGALVFANILAGPLVKLAPTLLRYLNSGGLLCLSGILASQGDTVLAAYLNDCRLQSQQEKEEWLQLGLMKH